MLAALLTFTGNSFAATIAFWTFEGDGVTTPTNGSYVLSTAGRTTITTDGILARDVSGNGNSVVAWDAGGAGQQYRPNVPVSIVPQTGVANTFSIQNAGGFPAGFTWSSNSLPTVDVETIEPLAWTVEASIYQTASATHETFVGRDGNGEAGFASDLNLAPFYFKTFNGVLQILFVDTGGTFYELGDTNGAIALNKWYNVAAVCDGTTLKLYKDSLNGAGYQLVNEMAVGGLPLNYDSEGSTTPNDAQWGWTIGRGRYGASTLQTDNHVDRFLGYIDNVRISDAALPVNEMLGSSTNVFIVSGPAPTAQTIAIGNPFSFSIVGGGESVTYQWRHAGTNLPGATGLTYSVAVSTAAHLGNYDVVLANSISSITSSVVNLTLHTPRNLTWGGLAGGWDTTTANWTTNNGGSFLAYVETDNVRLDPFGLTQPVVTLSAPHAPTSVVVSNASYTVAGSNITSGALSLQNNASLTISNVITFSSSTISSGTLHLRTTNNNLGALSIANGGVVQLHGNSVTASSLSGAGLINSTSGAPVLTFGSDNANATWSGSFTNETGGMVSFIKTGTGTNTFTGTNYLASTNASQINGGTLMLPTGSRINPVGTAELWIGQGATTGRVEVTGGFLGTSNWLVVGRANTNGNGTLILNSGTISKQGSGNLVVGSLDATGTLIVNGGQVLNNANLWLGEGASANGTLRLNGGLLQATQIRANGAAAPATSYAYFNGGTLQASGSSADFIPTPTIGMIQAGGLVFDSSTNNITITSILTEDSLTPSTGGGLTKLGAGTLTLSGGYSYTGPTIVRGGTLSLNPAAAYTSPNLVVSNATLALPSATGTLPAGNVTLGNGAVLSLNFGVLPFGNPATPSLSASGNLTAAGTTITINITGTGFTAGTIPLITYGGTPLGNIANFVLGALPPGMGANLVNNPNSLDLNITVAGQNLSWYGDVNNIWDINSAANWANSMVPGAKYLEYTSTGDPVRLDDTAVGNYDINLTTSVHPFSVQVDAANNYSITGAGGITGSTSLVKSNTGTLFLGTANTYSGGAFVYNGTLAISNNAALGSASVPVTLAGGKLQLENNTTLPATRTISATAVSTIGVPAVAAATVAGNITGTVAVSKVDDGVLNITGSNSITGALNINQGTVNFSGTNTAALAAPAYMGVGSALGSGTLNLLPGANISRFETKLGNQTGAKGTLNMTNATLVTGGGEIWIGGSADNIITEGEMNVVNSSVVVSNWTAIGRSFGASLPTSKGVLNLIGGTWTNRGANHFVIGSAPTNNATMNVVNGGTLVVGIGTTQNNQLWVSEQGNGILNINNGNVFATRTASPALVVGRGFSAAVNAAGSIRLTSGVLDSADQTFLGHGTGSAGTYAELNQMGGKFISRWYIVVGFNNDRAIYRQSGGEAYLTNAFMTIGAGGTASIGIVDLSGGTFTALDAGGGGGIYVGENGNGTLNVRGSSSVSVAGTATGGGLRIGNAAATVGIVNLNTGGKITANRVSRGTQGAASTAILNFNGGRLNARMNNTTFLTNISSAFIHAGGATIDDGGFAVTVAQPLLAPVNNGVTSIAVADGGANYIGAPLVNISGGTGANCTAVANMVSDGSGNGTFSVGSITITSPGSYTVDPTTVTFLGGGQNSVTAVAGAITTAANTSGGLTKLGSGTLNLNGVNTYTGATTVSTGTLGGSGTIAGAVVVASGASLAPGNSGVGTLTLGASPTLNAGSTIVAELSRTNAQTSDRLAVTGTLAYNGTLVLKNVGTPLQVNDTFTVFNASSYSGSFTIVSQTPGQVVTWNTSQLAVNGTVSVATVAPVSMGAVVSDGTLNLSWPGQLGMRLETNAVSVANPAAWFTYPGSASVTNVSLPIDATKTNVFFRLVYP